MVSSAILKRINNETLKKRSQILKDSVKREREFLQFVKKFMCKGSKIVFVQCQSGAGPEGDQLKSWLSDIMGPDVDVTLFDTNVKWWYFSRKKCSSREVVVR